MSSLQDLCANWVMSDALGRSALGSPRTYHARIPWQQNTPHLNVAQRYKADINDKAAGTVYHGMSHYPPPAQMCSKTSDISKEYPDYLSGNLHMKTTDVRTEATALGSGPTELSSIIYTLQNTLMSPNIHIIRWILPGCWSCGGTCRTASGPSRASKDPMPPCEPTLGVLAGPRPRLLLPLLGMGYLRLSVVVF